MKGGGQPGTHGRRAGIVGLAFLAFMLCACLLTLPWTLSSVKTPDGAGAVPRYNAGTMASARLAPWWAWWEQEVVSPEAARGLNAAVDAGRVAQIAARFGVTEAQVRDATEGEVFEAVRAHWPRPWMGTDALGRSLAVRCLAGGGVSLLVGALAALLSVFIGTVYGAIAGYAGGRVDAVMMRTVDVLYGLPYVLLVVLLAVAGDALIDEYISRGRERAAWVQEQAAALGVTRDDAGAWAEVEARSFGAVPARSVSAGGRLVFDVATLLVAIGGVSWLTMARVIRGQVLSLKSRPFVEAARAIGVPAGGIFSRHLLPNLAGTIIVYATLTVPQAILQESFLSFLGIGVKPPLPSWGTLAADGLSELNPYESNWWLLLFPCVLLGLTLLSLNFVGEWLRTALDPRSREARGGAS